MNSEPKKVANWSWEIQWKNRIYIYMVSSLLPHVAAVHLVLLQFLTDCGVENTAHGPLERCNSSCNSSCWLGLPSGLANACTTSKSANNGKKWEKCQIQFSPGVRVNYFGKLPFVNAHASRATRKKYNKSGQSDNLLKLLRSYAIT